MANRISTSEHAGSDDYFVGSFDQLTAVGASEALKVHGLETHVFQAVIADVDTNVIIRFEGSLDGVNYANIAADVQDETLTTDGTYIYSRSSLPLEYVRVRYVSESGSTTPTVDVTYAGRM